jgi:hypothetical protein
MREFKTITLITSEPSRVVEYWYEREFGNGYIVDNGKEIEYYDLPSTIIANTVVMLVDTDTSPKDIIVPLKEILKIDAIVIDRGREFVFSDITASLIEDEGYWRKDRKKMLKLYEVSNDAKIVLKATREMFFLDL